MGKIQVSGLGRQNMSQIAAIFLPTEFDVIRRYLNAVSLFNEGNRFLYEGIATPLGRNWVSLSALPSW